MFGDGGRRGGTAGWGLLGQICGLGTPFFSHPAHAHSLLKDPWVSDL